MDQVDMAARYLEIKDEIKELEEEKRNLAKDLVVGTKVQHNGVMYEWISYETGSTAWKGLYEQAYAMLDDSAQVIMGEAVDNAFKPRVDHKFEKKA